MLMRLRMLKLSVGKGRHVTIFQSVAILRYSGYMYTERAVYVLYTALVLECHTTKHVDLVSFILNISLPFLSISFLTAFNLSLYPVYFHLCSYVCE